MYPEAFVTDLSLQNEKVPGFLVLNSNPLPTVTHWLATTLAQRHAPTDFFLRQPMF